MEQSMPMKSGHAEHGSHLVRHIIEMTLVMIVSMIAGAAVFLTPQGLTVDEALVRYPVLFVVVIAVSMAVAMVAWMRFRGHNWRSCSEMAACMVVPAIPFIGLFWLGLITGPFCGLFCIASFVAMIALMVVRRDEYGMAHA